MQRRIGPIVIVFALTLFVSRSSAQQSATDNATPSDQPPNQAPNNPPSHAEPAKIPALTNKRILWIIPNYRTSPSLADYAPISAKEKFRIARQDSFDPGTVVLAALFAGEAQLTNSTPEFGQGVRGYAKYFAASYTDLVIGDFMTESVYPTLLHQDPRYFRRGTGSGVSRLGYAVGQIFWTHRDGGGSQFNFSEIGGNATAVAISNAYYPGTRDARTAASKLGMQIGVDMVSNILKEFWPDLDRKFARKHRIKPGRE